MRAAFAIASGLAVAAALIVIPRATLFEERGRDACQAAGAGWVGLANGAGRWADPVPDGARCELPDHGIDEVDVRFFADGGFVNAVVGWLYRLACILVPLGTALVIWRAVTPRVPRQGA